MNDLPIDSMMRWELKNALIASRNLLQEERRRAEAVVQAARAVVLPDRGDLVESLAARCEGLRAALVAYEQGRSS